VKLVPLDVICELHHTVVYSIHRPCHFGCMHYSNQRDEVPYAQYVCCSSLETKANTNMQTKNCVDSYCMDTKLNSGRWKKAEQWLSYSVVDVDVNGWYP
jgi:hypothetical protein